MEILEEVEGDERGSRQESDDWARVIDTVRRPAANIFWICEMKTPEHGRQRRLGLASVLE